MSEADRARWDERYSQRGSPGIDAIGIDPVFTSHLDEFPAAGRALDLACGPGLGSVWLARRGLDVWGLDVSAVAIGQARNLAARIGVIDRCRFDVVDLDGGLPAGPAVDLVYCRKFRDRRLDRPIIDRLLPGGLLAVVALIRADGSAGSFRVAPGELCAAFAGLDVLAAADGDGAAWLLARRR